MEHNSKSRIAGFMGQDSRHRNGNFSDPLPMYEIDDGLSNEIEI
jgi:hypothetical protein